VPLSHARAQVKNWAIISRALCECDHNYVIVGYELCLTTFNQGKTDSMTDPTSGSHSSDRSSRPQSQNLIMAIPRESFEGEQRVALAPSNVSAMAKLGFEVFVQSNAGIASGFDDSEYEKAGAKIESNAQTLISNADVVLKVRAPLSSEISAMKPGAFLASLVMPAQNTQLLAEFAKAKVSVLALDAIPRTTRAQKMDVLSSMGNLAGYRSVIEAAGVFSRPFTGQITAAGKMPPAKIMVIGAGVAGLAAIGAGRALGAVVRAFDTRPEVKEQITSMGAEFLELNFHEDGRGEGGYAKVMSPEFIKAEMELFAKQSRDVDIIITTALIPGVKAPVLITEDMVRSMRRGSVVVDLAAEQGGNCALTKAGKIVVENGVSIIGYTDLPSRMASQASQLLGNNMVNLIDSMCGTSKERKAFRIDLDDDIVRPALVSHAGNVTWPPPKKGASATPTEPSAKPAAVTAAKPAQAQPAKKKSGHGHGAASEPMDARNVVAYWAIVAVILYLLGRVAPPEFINHLTVFILACFIGYQLIWNVTPALHTPLMSVTNAISGIIVVGAMLQISGPLANISTWLAAVAVLVATVNIAGGFLVTQRMLKMFRK
jgi:NAD(P) transhydrogenase subunit alpha